MYVQTYAVPLERYMREEEGVCGESSGTTLFFGYSKKVKSRTETTRRQTNWIPETSPY